MLLSQDLFLSLTQDNKSECCQYRTNCSLMCHVIVELLHLHICIHKLFYIIDHIKLFPSASPCQHLLSLPLVSQISRARRVTAPLQHTYTPILDSSDLPPVAGYPSSLSCPSFSLHSLSLSACVSLLPQLS